MEDYLNIARKIFVGTRYEASEEDLKRLADNMALLEKRGLSKLNQRLINSGRGVWATIAEHNFAVILVSQHSSTIPISYEPDIESRRPPDFEVKVENITYWIQMKDLSKLERENRQDKLIQKTKEKVKEIKVGKFFSCMLSDDFEEGCLPELVDFIKNKTVSAAEDESFFFTGKNNQKAEIKFWSAGKIALSELTLGYTCDLEMLEITGLAREQIKQSLLNAVGAFDWEVDQRNINLIVMEADNKEDIDICDALFGSEYEITSNDSQSWSREDDGLFGDSDFSKKVAGVIVMKRKPKKMILSPEEERIVEGFAKECNITSERYKKQIESKRPVTDYCLILYMNNMFKHLLDDIKKLLSFDIVVYYNMRPSMGQGNFE